MTSEDVAYSINTAANSPYNATYTSSIEKAEPIDKFTVKVVLKYPYSSILGCFTVADLSIFNKKSHESDPKAFGRNPIGTGPYMLKDWIPGDKIIIEAFPDYYRGEAAIKEIVFKIIKDTTTALLALEKGDVDFMYNPDQADRQRVINNENLMFYECDSAAMNVLAFNSDENSRFSNEKLRQTVTNKDLKGVLIYPAVKIFFYDYSWE
jgi:peptide/nickel transport system substrate-binding protein